MCIYKERKEGRKKHWKKMELPGDRREQEWTGPLGSSMLRDPFLEMVTEEGRKDFLCMEPKWQETQKNVTIVVFHTFNSGTGLGLVTGRWISEFKFSLVFRWSYRSRSRSYRQNLSQERCLPSGQVSIRCGCRVSVVISGNVCWMWVDERRSIWEGRGWQLKQCLGVEFQYEVDLC